MSNLIIKNYKVIISIILGIIILPIIPILIEVLFKLGNIVGTYIRLFGSNVCF